MPGPGDVRSLLEKGEEQILKDIPRSAAMRPLAWGFILFNAVDVLLTLCVLEAGGYELNPLMRAILELGVPTTTSLKLGVSALFAWGMYRLRLDLALRVATAFILGVCLFNVANLALL